MKRTLFLTYIFLLTALFSVTVYAQGGLAVTVIETARLRSGPGTEWRLVGTVNAGGTMNLDGRDPTGTWVRGITQDGVIGWVIGSALGATTEQLAVLPSIWVDTPFNLGAPAGGAPPAANPPAADAPVDTPAEAPAAPPVGAPVTGGITVTVNARVNMRSLPNTSAPVLLTLTPGTQLTVDGRNPSGEWVRGGLPNGTFGWVAARFLSITVAQLTSLPVVDGAGAVIQAGNAPSESAPAPAAPLVNTAPVRGFSYGGHVDAFGDYAVQSMHRAGMTWAKRQIRYSAGQNPADFAWMINDAHAKGFRILLGIVGHTWEVNNPGYYDTYASFVAGIASLGADAIEVWNEMNIDREWPSGSISPSAYTDLLRRSYNAIKGANSNTMVITGAPAPTGFFGGCSGGGCDDAPYIAGMASAGAANYADCIGIHYNEGVVGPTQNSGDPRGNSSFYSRYFSGMMNTYGRVFGSKPLCFTELGYLTGEGFPPLPGGFAWASGVTLQQQASWLDQAVSLAAQSGRVRLLIVWNVDFTQYGDDPMAGFAIIRPNGSCPACDALGS
jgi:uncharacterized protein YraI